MSRPSILKPFNLLRWFSVVSMVVIAGVSVVIAIVVSHYFVSKTIERDALLTAQFIQTLAEAEVRHADLGRGLTMGQFLDDRVAPDSLGVPRDELDRVRAEFYDHIRYLPDALLATVFAPDGMIVWSTNAALIGVRIVGNEDLDETVRSREMVARGHIKMPGAERTEQQFVRQPQDMYIENYIPLLDGQGKLVSVVEVYKEPAGLIATLREGYLLVWLVTVFGSVAIYLSLFWIVRRAAMLLKTQQQTIVENETLVALGEMSSAVAHGLRNPLAAIRSSAELALDADPAAVQKSIGQIISQVDRLSRWVRELLLFARPMSDEREEVDLSGVTSDVLRAFDQQIRQAGIQVDFAPTAPLPPVTGHVALVTQALNSIFANAIEAMPKGGRLGVSIGPDPQGEGLMLTVSDTGAGMSETQLELAFKPFHTTKRSGLGVGLPLVKRIMERFGGAIRIESREKQGTNIYLSFRFADRG